MSNPMLFAVTLKTTVLVQAEDPISAMNIAEYEEDQIILDTKLTVEHTANVMALSELECFAPSWKGTDVPYGGDGVTETKDILPAKLEPADRAEPAAGERINYFDKAASKKLTGSTEDLIGFKYETLDDDTFLVTVGPALRLPNGKPRADFTKPQRVALTSSEIDEVEREYLQKP